MNYLSHIDISEKVSAGIKACQQKMEQLKEVDLNIQSISATAFKTMAVAFAAWLNPSFFWTAFFVGLIWDKEVKMKLEEIWSTFKGSYYKIIAISTLMTVIKLPVALLTYSIWIGAKLGSSLKTYDAPSPVPAT